MNTQQYVVGLKFNLQTIEQLGYNKVGYTFAGWTGSDNRTFTDGQQDIIVTTDTYSVSANWEENQYILNFDDSGEYCEVLVVDPSSPDPTPMENGAVLNYNNTISVDVVDLPDGFIFNSLSVDGAVEVEGEYNVFKIDDSDRMVTIQVELYNRDTEEFIYCPEL